MQPWLFFGHGASNLTSVGVVVYYSTLVANFAIDSQYVCQESATCREGNSCLAVSYGSRSVITVPVCLMTMGVKSFDSINGVYSMPILTMLV